MRSFDRLQRAHVRGGVKIAVAAKSHVRAFGALDFEVAHQRHAGICHDDNAAGCHAIAPLKCAFTADVVLRESRQRRGQQGANNKGGGDNTTVHDASFRHNFEHM